MILVVSLESVFLGEASQHPKHAFLALLVHIQTQIQEGIKGV